jgi:hypothetical protein
VGVRRLAEGKPGARKVPDLSSVIAVMMNISLVWMLVASSALSSRTEIAFWPFGLAIVVGIGSLFLMAEMLFRIDKPSDIDE